MSEPLKRTYLSWLNGEVKSEQKEYTDSNGNTVKDTCTVTVKYTWWQWLIIIFLFGWLWY